MENTENIQKQQSLKSPFTLFGIPVIQSKCQRDAFLYGITGGIAIGLVAFLFTSHAKYSANISFGSYVGITMCGSLYCIYNEHKMRKEMKMIKKVMREACLEENN